MAHLVRCCYTSILLMAISANSAATLTAQCDSMGYRPDSLEAAARAIMKAARYATLVTLDESGWPQARPMDPFPLGDDLVVWLGTHRGSRKVRQIAADPRVALHYLAPDATGYVSINGVARLVDDPEEEARHWKEEWERFYVRPETDYMLIAVSVQRLEILDYSRGIVGDSSTWAAPSLCPMRGTSPP